MNRLVMMFVYLLTGQPFSRVRLHYQ